MAHTAPHLRYDDGNPDPVGLSFVDLLYAVPVADLATRVSDTHLHHVTPSGWTDLAVALWAITLGWIGHHTNRRLMPSSLKAKRLASTRPFFELRFIQFLIEVLVVFAYFALGTRAVLPAGAGVGHPSMLWKAELLVILFVLYLIWDGFDILIAKDESEDDWALRAKWGGQVTVVFFVVFAVVLGLVLTGSRHPGSVVWFDVLLLVLLYVYRLAQQWYCRHRVDSAKAKAAQPAVVEAGAGA